MVLLHTYAIGQNIITGKITDQEGRVLVGAAIFIPELNKGTVTDINGHFKLTNMPNGMFNVHVSFLGYTSKMETIDVSNKSNLNISLNQAILEAEEVVISGGYNSTQHSNAMKIDILKVNKGMAKSSPNFMELLTQVPGVDMISKGSGVSKPVIRGLSMNDVLVLNNGVRFENYQYSSHHPLGIDEFGIEDIEIIKGPASLLYGSDAIGGVINFIKEKPAPIGTILGDYNIQYFSNSIGMANNIGIKGSTKKFFGGLRVGQKTNSDFLQGGGDFVPNSRFNELSVKTNAGFTDRIGTFKLFYDFNNQKLGLVEEEAIAKITQRGRKNEIMYQQFDTHLFSSQNNVYLGKFKLELNSSYQNTELVHFGDPGVYEIQMQLATITYEARLHLPSRDNSTYILGFQGLKQANTNLNERETKLLPNAVINNGSIFGLLQSTFFGKLKMQTGLRYDHKTISTESIGSAVVPESYRKPVDRSFSSFSGSLGGTYYLNNELLFRVNYASAYRTPNLAELTSNGPHELRYEVGETNLVPEYAHESDISLHYHHDNYSFDLAGFYNLIKNYIFIAPTSEYATSGMSIFRYRQADSFLYGGELGFHLHPSIMKWLHLESAYSSVVGKQMTGQYLPFVPAHKLRLELRGEKERLFFLHKLSLSFSTSTSFDQNFIAPDETITKGYTLIDMSIQANILLNKRPVSVSVGVNNLGDKKYIDHLSTLKEVNRYNPGRNVSFSLKIPFGIVN